MVAGASYLRCCGYQSVRVGLVAALTLCSAAVPASACSIPVFRYALEHWAPDGYRVHVFHTGPLTGEQQSLVDTLRRRSETANVVVATIDTGAAMDDRARAAWESLKSPVLPAVVVQLPGRGPDLPVLWFGRLDEFPVESFFSSPARTQLVRELESGVSAVWIFLESGNIERDDALFEMLNSELERLQQSLKLPPVEEADLAQLTGSPAELKIRFSSVRVSRDNPQEAMLVNMLLSTEPDLRDPGLVSQPMVFPVFGRGRALYALVGEGISSALIEEGCRFLTSACQCTVKLQNPGTDLLLTAGWKTYVAPEAAQSPEYVAIPDGPAPVAAMTNEVPHAQPAETASALPSASGPAGLATSPTQPEVAPGPTAAEQPIVGGMADGNGFSRWQAIALCLAGGALILWGLLRRG